MAPRISTAVHYSAVGGVEGGEVKHRGVSGQALGSPGRERGERERERERETVGCTVIISASGAI